MTQVRDATPALTKTGAACVVDTGIQLGTLLGLAQIEIGVVDGDGDGLTHFGLRRDSGAEESRHENGRRESGGHELGHRKPPATDHACHGDMGLSQQPRRSSARRPDSSLASRFRDGCATMA